MKKQKCEFKTQNINGYDVQVPDYEQVREGIARVNKRRKINAIVGSIVGVLVFVLVLNMLILPLTGEHHRHVDKVEFANKYITNGNVMVSAHRAGGDLEPEETLAAFKNCIEAEKQGGYKVDILEFDLHLTKDDVLVLQHDHEVDRTSDGPIVFGKKGVKVCDKTLDELKQLNFGYNFVDKNGVYKYRQEGAVLDDVRILTLDEVLDYVEGEAHNDKSMHYIIEIKDDGERGKTAMQKLYEQLVRRDMLNRTVVGTFHGDITKFIDDNYKGEVVRSSSIIEVLNFYFAFLWGRQLDVNKLGYSVLQIPMGLDGFFDLSTKAFIDYAHTLGLAVQYWTINDPDDVRLLAQNGADCIMTDDPQMAYNAVHQSY